MTGLLKDLMHERADRLDTPVLDLAAITREGDRRIRRRRLAAGAVGAAAAITVAGFAPRLVDDGGRADDGDVATSDAGLLTWAAGSTIHAGGEAIDVGHRIHAFVETEDGYVFTDPDGAVWVWADGRATRTGQVARDGDSSAPELVTDGQWTAWVAASEDGAAFEYVGPGGQGGGFAAGAAAAVGPDGQPLPEEEQAEPPAVYALVDGTAYYFDGTATQASRLADDGAGEGDLTFEGRVVVEDVVDGLYLLTTRTAGPGGEEATRVTRDPAQAGRVLDVRGGDLSPDGRYVMSENSARASDDFTLLDVTSGEELTPAIAADYGFFLGYAWADADTYSAFGLTGIGGDEPADVEIDLLTCSASARTCTVAAEGPESVEDFELPVGMHIGD